MQIIQQAARGIAVAMVALLAGTACVEQPVEPQRLVADGASFAKGGKGVGGGTGSGKTEAPGQQDGGGKQNAPGKGDGGGDGGGGGGSDCSAGCSWYAIDLNGVCFDGPNIGCDLVSLTASSEAPDTYDLLFKVGDYVGDLESTKAAPCPTTLPSGIWWYGNTQPTWSRIGRGSEIWCELLGVYRTGSQSSIQIQLPDGWEDPAMTKGDFKFQLFGNRGNINSNDQVATFRYCTLDENFDGSCTRVPESELLYSFNQLVATPDTPFPIVNIPPGSYLEVSFFLTPRP
jgi:hypothetical protein